ncbi:type VI secretion system baseplate subunit TssG [Aquabacter sp. CN5-332]|uniref:type VI secretion system baseplate subunit TssG n=1 Tax=Aquabacter sp. CN5-332 TaxID=3156608 RepID=UPI0032B38EDE
MENGAFFAIIQRLEQLFPDMPPFGGTQDPSRERVRFRANPSLGYPAREVDRFVWNEDDQRLDVIVNFLGLQGPSSPLPPFFTEEVIDDAGDGGVLGTFFDLFNHRLVSLLVRIQKHQRHYLRYDGGAGDPISLAVASLMGLLPAAAEGQRVALMPYVGLLSCYSLSASIIATIIGHCTNLPVRIDEFVERTVTIPAHSRSNLGDAPPQLGLDFIVGSDVQDHVGKFRVVIGPLDRATFARVLPDQPLFADVIRLVELALRDPLAFDIRLELEKGAPFAFVMGEGRLGWNMWLAPPDDASGHADFAGDRFAEAM